MAKQNPADELLSLMVDRMESISDFIAEKYGGVPPFDRKIASPSALRKILKSYADMFAKRSNRMMGG